MIFFGNTYQALMKVLLPSKVKRYIVKTELNFTAQRPAGGKLRVFNSYKELIAGADNDGKSKFVDVTKKENQNLLCQLQPSTLNILMTANNHLDYLQKNAFNLEVFADGRRFVCRYEPKQMRFTTLQTADKQVYERYKAIARLEAEANEFIKQARNNALLIAEFAKIARTEAQKAKLREMVVNHQFAINQFRLSLPPEVKVQVRAVDVKIIQQAVSIGVLPVVVIIIAAIVVSGGVAAYTFPKIMQIVADTVKHRNNLVAQQANIQRMIEVESSSMSEAAKERIRKQLEQSNKNLQQQNQQIVDNGSKSFFDDVGPLVKWIVVGYAAAKIIPPLLNRRA